MIPHQLNAIQMVILFGKIRSAYDEKLTQLREARTNHINSLIAETHTDSMRLRQTRIRAIDEEIRTHEEMRDLVLLKVGELGETK